MASWLEDVLAQLQGGGVPTAYGRPSMAFPDPRENEPTTAGFLDEFHKSERDQASKAFTPQMLQSGERAARIPFGYAPMGEGDLTRAGIDLAMGQGPAGTGVPGPLGQPQITPAELAMMPGATGALRAGAPDGTPFGAPPNMDQFAMTTVGGLPPSVQQAKAMTAPPPQPAGPQPVSPPLAAAGAVPPPLAAAGPPPATDVSAARRAPRMAGGPVVFPEPPQKSFAERLADLGPGLVAMGAILQGEGSGASERMALNRQRQAELAATQNVTAQALLARGAPPQEVAAAIRNPELLKALVGRYFETKAPQVVNGRLVRERPDGTVETLADFHEEKDKAPTQREVKLADGSVQRQEWVGGKWNNVGKPAPGERDRRLSVSDVTKLADEGGKLRQIEHFQAGFKPEFAGWKANTVGDLANMAGRNLPEGVVGKNLAASAAWWQDYDRYKNMVRHELFGSALTKAEQDAFMRADIGPGMTAEQVSRNLATQRRVVEQAIRRKGKGLIGSTYDRDAIASAYGVKPEFFDQADDPPGVPAPRRSGQVTIGGKKLDWSLN